MLQTFRELYEETFGGDRRQVIVSLQNIFSFCSSCKYSQKGGNRETFVALKCDKAETDTGPAGQTSLRRKE